MAPFEIGKPITIHHRKPWQAGRPIQMRGRVAHRDDSVVIVERRFRNPSQRYDGLYTTQQPGDWGTIELRLDSWVARRRYLRAHGSLIGELYNVQTPTRFLPDSVEYVDLEIDVAYLPDTSKRVMVQDADQLRMAVARGHIPHDVAAVARHVAEELARRLRQWDGQSELDWDVRPDEALITPIVEHFLRRWSGAERERPAA